jgi:hypothetical protein
MSEPLDPKEVVSIEELAIFILRFLQTNKIL